MTPAPFASLLAACRERAAPEAGAERRLSVLHLAHGPGWMMAWAAARADARVPGEDGTGG